RVLSFDETQPTEIYTLSLHDALPIWIGSQMANERISCAIKGNYISPEGAVELRSTGQPRAAVPTSVLPRGLILVRSLGVNDIFEIGRAHVELQSRENLVCRLLLEKKK